MEKFQDFIEDFLYLHNQYRESHGAPPLLVDNEMNDSAQQWADTIAENRAVVYKGDPEYGENIFAISPRAAIKEIKPSDPLESWYREGRYFRYGEEVEGLQYVRHFTQMLWKNSTFIGMGMSADDNDRMYFVCLYHPRGNIEGEFAENVLPLPEFEGEMEPQEAEEIRMTECKPDVAKSMERLYAVPSEKLRVWAIWLSQIGGIAEEWQRWLRAHIDLYIRLSEQLMEAQEAMRLTMEQEEVEEVEVLEEPIVIAEVQVIDEDIDLIDFGSSDDDGEMTEDRFDYEDETETIVEETRVVEEVQIVQEGSIVEEEVITTIEVEETVVKVDEEVTVEAEGEEKVELKEGEEDTEELQAKWPLGTPWKHSGIEDPDDTPPFERIPFPANEEEMVEIMRDFKHQATVFSSYYKHWTETGDWAVRDVTSRQVVATYIAQGKDETGKPKAKPCPPPPPKKAKRPPAKRKPKKPRDAAAKKKKKAAKAGVKDEATEEEEEQAEEAAEAAPEAAEEEEAEAAAAETAEAPEEEPPPAEEEAPTKEEDQDKEPSVAEATKTKTAEAPMTSAMKLSKSLPVTMDDLVRDCARAAEPVPYEFYVKAEPDIEIAIEYDDEEVIAADKEIETITCNFKRVKFNLIDKPCKGGKPWV